MAFRIQFLQEAVQSDWVRLFAMAWSMNFSVSRLKSIPGAFFAAQVAMADVTEKSFGTGVALVFLVEGFFSGGSIGFFDGSLWFGYGDRTVFVR